MGNQEDDVSKIVWKKIENVYSVGEYGYVGKWRIFGIGDKMYSRDINLKGDLPRHLLTCNLPGIKTTIAPFHTIEELKERAEGVFQYWMNGLSEENYTHPKEIKRRK